MYKKGNVIEYSIGEKKIYYKKRFKDLSLSEDKRQYAFKRLNELNDLGKKPLKKYVFRLKDDLFNDLNENKLRPIYVYDNNDKYICVLRGYSNQTNSKYRFHVAPYKYLNSTLVIEDKNNKLIKIDDLYNSNLSNLNDQKINYIDNNINCNISNQIKYKNWKKRSKN